MKTKYILCFMLAAFVAACSSFIYIGHHNKVIHQKALAIGLYNAPRACEERHVWITDAAHEKDPLGDMKVHIMYRTFGTEQWSLCGTGSVLKKYPGPLLTAYHVFEGHRGSYGWRVIGHGEITGENEIYPITSIEYSNDDAVLCTITKDQSYFPIIDAQPQPGAFKMWQASTNYAVKILPTKIRFSTYPEKEIPNLFSVEVTQGKHYLIFDWDVFPGESGTTAYVSDQKSGTYLIIVASQQIPQTMYDQLTPENKKLFRFSPDKLYGMGYLIQIP